MHAFRKKPVLIQAVQWTGENRSEVRAFADADRAGGVLILDGETGVAIETLEGTMLASPGDWIIRGVKGEFYPCKPDIFEATYEPAAPVQDAAAPPTTPPEGDGQDGGIPDAHTDAETVCARCGDDIWPTGDGVLCVACDIKRIAASGRLPSHHGQDSTATEPHTAAETAGYQTVITRLHRDGHGQLVDGDVVVSAVSGSPTLRDAVDEILRAIAPADAEEG